MSKRQRVVIKTGLGCQPPISLEYEQKYVQERTIV